MQKRDNCHKSKRDLLKSILLFSFSTLFVLLLSLVSFANVVDNIDIDVNVADDGSAIITQQWTGTFNEGTEVYLPIEDRSLSIDDFKVYKDDIEYSNIGNWNVNADFNEKAYKCGINKTTSGIELCFGISEYGNNSYIFSYRMDPLVKSYEDLDALKCMFVNIGMSTFPTDVRLRLHLENGKALNTDIARIWGFGFDGEVYIENGEAYLFSDSKLTGNDYAILMMSFEKGLLNPKVEVNDTFENLRSQSFEGSSYNIEVDNSSDFLFDFIVILINFLTFAVPIIIVCFLLFKIVDRKNKLKKFYKNCDYFRDNPNHGNIAISHALFEDFDIWNSNNSNVIGAIIIKMINDGCLEPLQVKSIGWFGKENTNTSIILKKEPEDSLAKELYNIIINAAGEDKILQENELKKYAKANENILYNYLNKIKSEGRNELNKLAAYKKVGGTKLSDLNEIGQKELSEVYGLRKFLEEFTLIKERSITESIVWEDLMVYATLFGNAKKVLNELKQVYPEKVVEIEKCVTTVYVSDIYFRALYAGALNARRAQRLANASRASSGFGGHTSFGGGFSGGFSGGGHGGGTR